MILETIQSVSFLSRRHILVAKRCPASDSPILLDVFDFLAARPEGSTKPPLVRRFQFPLLAAQVSVHRLTTRSDPEEASSNAPASNSLPFCTTPNSRLLTVKMGFSSGGLGSEHNCVLFVHNCTLLEGLEACPIQGQVVVPWEDWGPGKTRMMLTKPDDLKFVNNSHGTRYVELRQSVGRSRLIMMNFNALALRRGKC